MSPLLFDGFSELSGGMNAGIASNLIDRNQVAAACNYSFRGGFARTRPPYENVLLTFANAVVEAHFTGIFQGSCEYAAQVGASGFIVSRGGRLFRISITGQTGYVTEITPVLTIVTTADFTVPALGANVTIQVNSETNIVLGSTVLIDGGSYVVISHAVGEITGTYGGGGGGPGSTVTAGTAILDVSSVQITEDQTNPATLDFVYLFQAEIFVIVCAAPQRNIVYDGTHSRRMEVTELPPFFIGAYGWGRIWGTLIDRRTFVAGDIVRGPSGTADYGQLDAILKMTENDFLNEGGSFGVPFNAGLITSMVFLATQDTSLGMGPLMVGTETMIFTVNAPVDRTTWKDLTYPIQSISLLDDGPQSPRCMNVVKGDAWFRSKAGASSFIVARRDMDMWGNTPMSREVDPITALDTDRLIFYASGANFDNRWFMTVSPYRTTIGVAHRGVVDINFDLVSSLRGKTAPAWEGLRTGLNVLQLGRCTIDGVERMFSFVANDSNEVELWELKPDKTPLVYDTFTTLSGVSKSITRTSIDAWINSRAYDFQNAYQPKILNMAELFIDDIVDSVTIVVKFRPDQYPQWTTWATIPICATVSQCTITGPTGFTCSVWQQRFRSYAARITLPMPPETCNTVAGIPLNIGHEFEFRLEQTGHARIRRFRPHAIPQPQETAGACPPVQATCTELAGCEDDWFSYSAHP